MAVIRKRTPKVAQSTTAYSDNLSLKGIDKMMSDKLQAFQNAFTPLLGKTLSQDVASFAFSLDRTLKEMEKAFAAFKEFMIEHKRAGGTTEPGKFMVFLTETEKRNPQWKDIAIKLARKLEGAKFDETVFMESIRKATKKSTSVSMKLEESV